MSWWDNYVYEFEFDGEKMDEYKRGLISGIMYMAAGQPEQSYTWVRGHDGKRWYKRIQCTGMQFFAILESIGKVFGRDIITYVR